LLPLHLLRASGHGAEQRGCTGDEQLLQRLSPGLEGNVGSGELIMKAIRHPCPFPRSLSDLGNRSENSDGREQILSILKVNSCSIDQESGEIWTVQTDLQQIHPKSDRLLCPKRFFASAIAFSLSISRSRG